MVWTERATRGRDPIIAGEAGAKCCGRYVGAMRFRWCFVEPMTGIEPAYSAWEADVLPLNYIGTVASEG